MPYQSCHQEVREIRIRQKISGKANRLRIFFTIFVMSVGVVLTL